MTLNLNANILPNLDTEISEANKHLGANMTNATSLWIYVQYNNYRFLLREVQRGVILSIAQSIKLRNIRIPTLRTIVRSVSRNTYLKRDMKKLY